MSADSSRGNNKPYGQSNNKSSSQGRGGKGGAQRGRGGNTRQGPMPIEVAVKSTRNALRRHSEGIKDEKTKLACRAVMSGIVGMAKRSASPSELLAVVEQAMHVVESSRPDFSQLPATLRATITFAVESPRRGRDVTEMLRLTLRHGYVLAADHIPRQARDDGSFRATALAEVLTEIGADYLDDKAFAAAAG